jgi:polyisoprenoid-binding protein YceI
LKSPDFLNTEAFPEMTFKGKVSESPRGDKFRVDGDLSGLGLVHRVSFDLENTGRMIDPWGRERASFSAQGSLDRKAFGITWNRPLGAFGFLVGDRVDFEIEVEAVLQEEVRTEGKPARPSATDQLPHRPGMVSGRSENTL